MRYVTGLGLIVEKMHVLLWWDNCVPIWQEKAAVSLNNAAGTATNLGDGASEDNVQDVFSSKFFASHNQCLIQTVDLRDNMCFTLFSVVTIASWGRLVSDVINPISYTADVAGAAVNVLPLKDSSEKDHQKRRRRRATAEDMEDATKLSCCEKLYGMCEWVEDPSTAGVPKMWVVPQIIL